MPSANEYVDRFLVAFTKMPIRVKIARSAINRYNTGDTAYFKRVCDNWLVSKNYDRPYMGNANNYYDCLVDSAKEAIKRYEQNAG